MGTFTDADLVHLLGEAGDGFAVPEDGAARVLDARDAVSVVPLHRRRWLQLSAAAAVTAAGLVLGVSLLGGGEPGRPQQVALEDVPLANTEQEGRQVGPAERGFPTTSQPLAPAAPTGGQAAVPGAAPPATAPVADGARVVKKGAISLVVEDDRVTPTLTDVQALAAAAGGVVAVADTQESGETPSGSVTLRVPVAAFERVVAQVRGLDAEVRSATTTGQDVTAQYADVQAQVRSLTAARERFLDILAGADTIGDVLAVQQRIDETTAQIDRLEGQRRVLADQSESATLQVTVTEADDPTVRQEPDTGLSKAFRDAGTGFTSGVEALVRLSGRGLLLALLAAAAYGLVRVGWRVSRRRLV